MKQIRTLGVLFGIDLLRNYKAEIEAQTMYVLAVAKKFLKTGVC